MYIWRAAETPIDLFLLLIAVRILSTERMLMYWLSPTTCAWFWEGRQLMQLTWSDWSGGYKSRSMVSFSVVAPCNISTAHPHAAEFEQFHTKLSYLNELSCLIVFLDFIVFVTNLQPLCDLVKVGEGSKGEMKGGKIDKSKEIRKNRRKGKIDTWKQRREEWNKDVMDIWSDWVLNQKLQNYSDQIHLDQ